MLQIFAWIWWLRYFIHIRADYLLSEIDENLHKIEIKFRFHINESAGILLYGADFWNNSLLIRIRHLPNIQKQLEINVNDKQVKDNISNLCNCSKCFDKSFYFEIDALDLANSSKLIHMKCNNKTSKLEIQQKNSAQWNSYPRPDKMDNNRNKTYIWMGNIGPYVSKVNQSYPPIKEQIIGCLEDLYFNNKSVTFKKIGTKVLPFCGINYIETDFNFTDCANGTRFACLTNGYSNRTVRFGNDCKSWITEDSNCKEDLPLYSNQNQSFLIKGSPSHSFTIQLTWKPVLYKMISLIQILLNNGSNILLYENNYTVFYIHNRHPKKLMRFTVKSVNNLLWNFTNNRFALSINDGEKIFTFHGYSIGNVSRINIGLPVQDRNCSTFEGLLRARFDPPELFEILSSSNSSNDVPKRHYFYHIFIICCISLAFIIILIVIKEYKTKIKNLMKKPATENVSNSEMDLDYFVLSDNSEYGFVCDKRIVF